MKFKIFLILFLISSLLFSEKVFSLPQNSLNTENQINFENYFKSECVEVKKIKDEEGENWFFNMTTRSHTFELLAQAKIDSVLKKQKIYADHQNQFHNCNCKFMSAAVSQKLTELGFENYELIAVTNPLTGDYYVANLYKTSVGNWVVADIFVGINQYAENDAYAEAAHIDLATYLRSLAKQNIRIVCVKNKPLETFKEETDQGLLDIRLFSAVYEEFFRNEPIKIPYSISNLLVPFYLTSGKRKSNPLVSFNNKIRQIAYDYNFNVNEACILATNLLEKNKNLLLLLKNPAYFFYLNTLIKH